MKFIKEQWPFLIFLAVLLAGPVAIGFGIAHWMPCPTDIGSEFEMRHHRIQFHMFIMWSTAWALIWSGLGRIPLRKG